MFIDNFSTNTASHPKTPILTEEEDKYHALMNSMIIYGMYPEYFD